MIDWFGKDAKIELLELKLELAELQLQFELANKEIARLVREKYITLRDAEETARQLKSATTNNNLKYYPEHDAWLPNDRS